MALTTCRECKKEVSSDAKTCPHCGTKAPAAKRKPVSAGVGCLIILVALGVFGAIADKASGPPASPARTEHPSSGSAHFVAKGGMVYKSKAAMDEGMNMIAREVHKTHPELLLPLLACLAEGGEAVTVLDANMGTREVLLDSGKQEGCRGWTVMENIVP